MMYAQQRVREVPLDFRETWGDKLPFLACLVVEGGDGVGRDGILVFVDGFVGMMGGCSDRRSRVWLMRRRKLGIDFAKGLADHGDFS